MHHESIPDEALAKLARRALFGKIRDNFPLFLRQCFATLNPATVYAHNWHIDLMCEYLQACQEGDIRRLIINVPPRSLKSLTVSVAWPAFLLGHNPAERIIAASYAAGLSLKHSMDCRHIISSDWYGRLFPEMGLSTEQNEKHKFTTSAFGHRIATSIGGTITGEGGNFLILDDPQNPAQVQGEATRRQANQWFDHTFATRLDDKRRGVIIVVMQRLHADDLTGHLLDKGGWERLSIPAIAERKTIYAIRGAEFIREAGSEMHPGREDAGLLTKARQELGSAIFAAQYQQEPVPEDGQMVRKEWLRRYTDMPNGFLRVVQSWDTAIKAGTQHDASVCLTIGECEEGHFILDALCLRTEYPGLRRAVERMAECHTPDLILMEDKASGQSLLQDLRRHSPHLPMLGICPTVDKVTRFAAVSALIEAGKLWLPKEAPWVAGFERELLAFPAVAHDDQVDALSQYLGWVRARAPFSPRIRKL